MSTNEQSNEKSGPAPRSRGQLFFIIVCLLIVTNAFTFYAMREEAARKVAKVSHPVQMSVSTESTLKDFDVVNAHEHLYRLEDVGKYFEAAEKTGVTRTLFVASSDFTLKGGKFSAEQGNDWNTEEILRVAQQFPGKVIPFCTIHPSDPEALDKVKHYAAAGCKGLKLYTGHSKFHDHLLDAPEMMPIYAWCEETQFPIVWHVGLASYGEEFDRVMQAHPNLVVILPHFGQAYWRPLEQFALLEKVMDAYPNVYTDTSLGTRDIQVGGLYVISAHPEPFRDFCNKYSDRTMFGTDMVVTGNKEKTAEWIEAVIRAGRDVLEKDTYHFWMAARGSKYAKPNADPYGVLRGLALDAAVLKNIYETTPAKLFPVTPAE